MKKLILIVSSFIIFQSCSQTTTSSNSSQSQSQEADYFNSGLSGWTTHGDAVNFKFESSGGNPGGYITATDGGQGIYFYYLAPMGFRGNKSHLYGGTISYDIFINEVSSLKNKDDIILEGDKYTITYNFDKWPSTVWTNFSATTEANGQWMLQGTPQRATEEQIKSVLSNVLGLKIRGEYRLGSDYSGLDNVKWTK